MTTDRQRWAWILLAGVACGTEPAGNACPSAEMNVVTLHEHLDDCALQIIRVQGYYRLGWEYASIRPARDQPPEAPGCWMSYTAPPYHLMEDQGYFHVLAHLRVHDKDPFGYSHECLLDLLWTAPMTEDEIAELEAVVDPPTERE